MDHFKPEPSTINTTQHESDNGQYPSMRPVNSSNPKNLHTTLKVMKQKNLKTPLERLSPTDPDYEVQLSPTDPDYEVPSPTDPDYEVQLENIKMPLERLSPTDPDYEVQPSPTDPDYEVQPSPTDPDYEVQPGEDVKVENTTQKHPGPLGRDTKKKNSQKKMKQYNTRNSQNSTNTD